ncbi:F-box protein CPR1-like [Cornus florida]|uniref:F-box protein CPR1-like n=1 Tax=Cornus florida TaxID=4283 RepID=UPI0028A151F4|nr:F-box protein CPR1-like [Cornus florida]
MSEFLPRDVLIDILARLPIKCLVQCTTVCKSWGSLIKNPSFISAHLNRSAVMNNDNKLLLVRTISRDQNEEHYSLHLDNQMFDEYAKFRFPLKSCANYYFRIIGSCNGVICLSDDLFTITNELYLWNPSIQKLMALPTVRVTFKSHGLFMQNIGFGFDPSTNDYKVIRIVYLNYVEIPPEVDIFTLSTGTWRNISHLGLSYIIDGRAPQAFLNEAAHWIASDRRGDLHRRLIVSFHMGDEIFREIMLPDWINAVLSYPPRLRVAKFQESLSLIVELNERLDANNCYGVWVMKEYGVMSSWTQLYTIHKGLVFHSLVGFRKKGEVLLALRNGYLVSLDTVYHDAETKLLTKLEICGSIDSWYKDSFYADAYMESLILLGVKPPVFHGKKQKLMRKPRKGDEKQGRE